MSEFTSYLIRWILIYLQTYSVCSQGHASLMEGTISAKYSWPHPLMEAKMEFASLQDPN